MTAEDIKTLPIAEKIQILEVIWEDLRTRFEHMEPPPQVRTLLDQRRARGRDGSAAILDWDSVKSGLGQP